MADRRISLSEVLDARVACQKRGIHPDRIQLAPGSYVDAGVGGVSGSFGGEIVGLRVEPGDADMVGGLDRQPRKYECVPRVWEPL